MATWDSTYNMWKGSTNSNQWGIWASIYELPGTTNIVNNTSVVRVDLWLGRTLSSGYPIRGTYNGYIEADRENYGGFPTQHRDISKSVNQSSVNIGPNVLVGTWDYTIQHNNDGSRNVRITTELTGQGFSPSYCVVDVVVGLSTIPRASTINPLSGYIESQSNIVINPYASFNHSVRIYFGNINKWLQSDGTLGNNEYIFPSSNIRPSFVIPTDFYSQFTSERGVGTIYVNTYSGGTKIGENHNTLTAICNPALCNPYATVTVFDVNSKTLAITKNKNDVIRYQSIMEITPTITVSGVNDTQTTLKSKSINGTIFTTDTARVVNPTDKSFTLKLVNSRNMSSEIIVEATGELIPYIPLTFSANLWRTEPTTGEVEMEYSGNYFAKNFKDEESNTVGNSLSLFWKYREKGTENWIDGTTLEPTIDANNNTYSGRQSLGTIFDYRKQYEFIILYNDKLMEQTSSIYPVSRGFPIFWWSEDAIHIMNKLYVGDKEIGSENSYSTDEIVIGKTSDGKNIYKKTLTGTTPSYESDWGLVASLPKNITLKKFDGILSGYLPFPTYINSNYYIGAQLLNSTDYTGIQLYVKGYTNANVEMTVEYIKGTEE